MGGRTYFFLAFTMSAPWTTCTTTTTATTTTRTTTDHALRRVSIST